MSYRAPKLPEHGDGGEGQRAEDDEDAHERGPQPRRGAGRRQHAEPDDDGRDDAVVHDDATGEPDGDGEQPPAEADDEHEAPGEGDQPDRPETQPQAPHAELTSTRASHLVWSTPGRAGVMSRHG